jgi:hypothetical protein
MKREKTKGKKTKKRDLIEPKSTFIAYKMRHLSSSFSCCFPSPRKNKRENPMKEYLNLIKNTNSMEDCHHTR